MGREGKKSTKVVGEGEICGNEEAMDAPGVRETNHNKIQETLS